MDHLSPERNIIQKNTTGDNVLAQNGNVYIDRSIHISLSEGEFRKLSALMSVRGEDYLCKIEEENRKLSEDNKRLTDMVLKLQRQLIDALTSMVSLKK